MTTPQVHTLKWGILATGGIARLYVENLQTDPSTREVTDVKHEVVAVGSRELENAEKFCEDLKLTEAKKYGSYESLVEDADVDIIYVASPHSEHFRHTMMALNAGKHVLCEKAFTVNEQQAKILCDTAKSKKLFLMEAQWTRFFPLSIKIREICKRGGLGTIQDVSADLSFGEDVERAYKDEHRMVNPLLAGGSLLDLGLYPCLWNFQILYHIADEKVDPVVKSYAIKYKTGVDERTEAILGFPSTIGYMKSGFRASTNPDGHFSAGPAIRINGSAGSILVWGPAYRPMKWTKVGREPGAGDAQSSIKSEKPLVEHHEEEVPGHGMFYQADECARCIRDGKLESETMPHQESIAMMKVFDAVRKENDLKFPDSIESTTYRATSWIPAIGSL